ncbi:MAG: DUF624 domain-containing protein [Actinomycetales bacterium]|nr:DUF624 domain-containing protein [Actinomycetales bacterium]
MFGFEQFVTINQWLTGLWRLAWLNLLWIVVTVLGLGVLGVGPASYALAKYLHRWFRHGETPPPARTFFRYCLELRWRPVLVAAVLMGAGGIMLVNLMSLSDWYLRAANLLALAVLWIITAYIFTVLAALDVQGLRAQLVSALLLGLGSLHWTILGTTASVVSLALMLRFAVPLLVLFGVALPAAVFALICSRILRDLDSPQRTDALPTRRTDASSHPLRKGIPA